jgi:hypothetical protein
VGLLGQADLAAADDAQAQAAGQAQAAESGWINGGEHVANPSV